MGFLGLIICTNRVCVSSEALDELLETKDGTHKISDKTGPSQNVWLRQHYFKYNK